MPWISRLLGPPSETISSVSDRASALAADQIAGAGTMAPAASPDTDFRKSRRFMEGSNARGNRLWRRAAQGSCQNLMEAYRRVKPMILLDFGEQGNRPIACRVAYKEFGIAYR